MELERDKLVRYLLGRSAYQEREEIAALLIADDQVAQALEDAERDLLDRYARGLLPHADRKSVEIRLLAGDRQNEKLRFARAFSYASSGRNYWTLGSIAAALLIAVSSAAAVAYLTLANSHLRQSLASSRQVSPASGPTAAVFLSPVQRGPGAADSVLRFPSGSTSSPEVIRLDLTGDAIAAGRRYSIQVTEPAGKVILDLRGALASGPALSVWLNAAGLPGGRYGIALYDPDGAPLNSYEFRIENK